MINFLTLMALGGAVLFLALASITQSKTIRALMESELRLAQRLWVLERRLAALSSRER